jgi:hypothetical protein
MTYFLVPTLGYYFYSSLKTYGHALFSFDAENDMVTLFLMFIPLFISEKRKAGAFVFCAIIVAIFKLFLFSIHASKDSENPFNDFLDILCTDYIGRKSTFNLGHCTR